MEIRDEPSVPESDGGLPRYEADPFAIGKIFGPNVLDIETIDPVQEDEGNTVYISLDEVIEPEGHLQD